MSTRFAQSPAFTLERIAYAILAAAMGVGLLSIIVAGFGASLPDAIASRAAAAQVACEKPSAPEVIGAMYGAPLASVGR